MKFLKAVRLDSSDTLVYSQEGAAQDGEWLVSGGYAVCDPTGATHRRPNCHCLTSFIGVVSHGRCTIAEIVEQHKRLDIPMSLEVLKKAQATALPDATQPDLGMAF